MTHEPENERSLLQLAIAAVIEDQRGTVSHLQRRLGLGYNRAVAVSESLRQIGVLGPTGAHPAILVDTMEAAIAKLRAATSRMTDADLTAFEQVLA